MTLIRHHWIALESGWRAFQKQRRKRLTELRRALALPDPFKEPT